MRNYADDVNLHTRIYAMKGRLLSLHDYTAMAREQEAFPDKNFGDPELIEAKESIFREQISSLIPLVEANEKYAPLFLAYIRQYEAHNLKLILAKAFGRQSLEQWYDIGPYAILNKELLKKNISLDQLQSIIANTYLSDEFKNISSFRRMEIRVEICTARNFYQSAAPLSEQAQSELKTIMIKRMAVLSVIWAYRLKGYYHWNDEKIRLYIEKVNDLFGGYALSQVRMVQEELHEYIEQLRRSGAQEPTVMDIERHLEHSFFAWISSMFYRDFHSINCVVAYLWLLTYQIRNMFSIIEGRRFGFDSAAILNKLICEA